MDPGKVSAVTDWPIPDSRVALQRFLGFANFYRRFIRNFSQVAAPLTALTSVKSSFRWSDAAQTAFDRLKTLFTTAPILLTPDVSRQFIVEVDASEVGVGAVLSQRSAADGKVHPCAFFSHRLSPAERNYDVGNRELLAIRLALGEWRQWLEGSTVPFLVWTDHRNLEYIRSAKRLNARQARWALFFTRFDFSISYRPGSKNVKPDALSRLFDSSSAPVNNDAVIPPGRFVGAIVWGIERLVRRALSRVTAPPECPRDLLFVPRRFWWPTLEHDTRRFVASCVVCAQTKSGHSPPAGLLRPLPVPARPWSHIALDFITGLPSSAGSTVILTVVDRFSKSAHFIPLPKLPSAKETAQIMVNHVFKLHGLPSDVVSDRGPQFASLFWKEFCRLIGATASLSSGYHPRLMGRPNGRIKALLAFSVVWLLAIPHRGLNSSLGLSTLITRIRLPPRPFAFPRLPWLPASAVLLTGGGAIKLCYQLGAKEVDQRELPNLSGLNWREALSVCEESFIPELHISYVQPETVQPETVQPETVQPETVQPETIQPENVQPETVQPETLHITYAEPETLHVITSKPVSKDMMVDSETVHVNCQSRDCSRHRLQASV
ncbi:retrotransposable element [Pimephales promelas]|nr:retrotransposable element [Pimephales promelas]